MKIMKFNKGITVIEVLVVITIFSIIGLSGINWLSINSKTSFGVNGLVETRCIEGYKFSVGDHGHIVQMIDAAGKGIACNNN